MILLMMQSRSGSSMVASIFDAHGYETHGSGNPNQFGYKSYEHVAAKKWLTSRKKSIDYENGRFCEPLEGVEGVINPNDCVKMGVEYWPCLRHLAAKVFCIRRDPMQIAKSLQEKRNKRNRSLQPPRQMWDMVKRREKMLDTVRDESGGVDIHVEPIVAGDFSGLRAAFEFHGLEFDEEKARAMIDPGKFKHR